jgi:RNA polymerase sigma factor (sigma-70 family)
MDVSVRRIDSAVHIVDFGWPVSILSRTPLPLPLALRTTAPRTAADDGHPVTLLPRSLDRLLSAQAHGGTDTVDGAWRVFIAEHTRLLLHVARSVSANHDDTMDAYAFVLEQLRADGFRRLREFAADPKSKLSTWLVVVARRLCLDLYRRRYGRNRGAESTAGRTVRRRLRDLVTEQLDVCDLQSTLIGGAELAVREAELREALDEALMVIEVQDRLLLRLRFDDDLSAQEIARLLGLPSPFHVYRRVNTLLGQLRRTLEQRGIASPLP